MELRVAGLADDSIVDGPGLRLTVFAQGCPHRCPGCHNPETHDFAGGTLTDTDAILARCRRNPLLSGVTLSGGEPFAQAAALAHLAEGVKAAGLHLMLYSGYTYEELLALAEGDTAAARLLALADLLVDGRFELAQRSLSLKFRGSRNQRILDLAASRAAGRPVEAEL